MTLQLIFHSCNHLLPELSLLQHTLSGSAVSKIPPLLKVTSLGANQVLIRLNLRHPLPINGCGGKLNPTGPEQTFAEPNHCVAQLARMLFAEVLKASSRRLIVHGVIISGSLAKSGDYTGVRFFFAFPR